MTAILDILHRAHALHQEGQAEEASVLYRRILVEDPVRLDALHLLGVAVARGGDEAQGLVLVRRALRCKPDFVPVIVNLGSALQRLGRVDENGALQRHWVCVDPDNPAALERLGRFCLAVGDVSDAGRWLRRLERLGGSNDRLDLALRRCAQYRSILAAAVDPSLPPGLVVRGVFRDGSGYAHKVRQFVRHLVKAGVRVQLIDLLHQPTDDLPSQQIDPLLLALEWPVRAKAVLSFTTPAAVEELPGLKTINYSVFEAARIPELWAGHSRRHDRVIVATPSSRDAWVASGHPAASIDVCPEGVEPIDPATVPPLALVDSSGRRFADYRTRFVNVSDFNPRKNLDGLLRVWLKATRAGDDAALVIKIGKGMEMAQLFAATVRAVMDEVGVAVEAAAPLFVVDGKFSDAAMLSLLATGTHYWSMSHGEGWDLPMAQSGAMGLTLLAPQHSAYTAYLDDTVAHMLPSEETDAYHAYKGLRWWTPDEEATAGLVARIIRAPDDLRRSARDRLCRDFTWEKAADRLIGLLRAADAL